MTRPQLAFYGDDFTGSTDAMEVLATAGVNTVLFTELPTQAMLHQEFSDAEAIGIAGTSRSMTPEEMDGHLPSIFETLDELDIPLVHYKVCSTFDSSPEIGSIGHAIDLAQTELDSPFVPVIVGAPELGRYVVFGNHFATMDGTTYRLDRHPVMSNHPVTPITEADLRRHLGQQTNKLIGLIDLPTISEKYDTAEAEINSVTQDNEIIFFDTFDEEHLEYIGRYLHERSTTDPDSDPLFVVGSSGVEYALTNHWSLNDTISGKAEFPALNSVDKIVVMSGSASPVTDNQIEWALSNGFTGVQLDTTQLLDPNASPKGIQDTIQEILTLLANNESVVAYTTRGPDDPVLAETKTMAQNLDIENVGRQLGLLQAKIFRTVLLQSDVKRACIAGGDTCGFITPELDIYALETINPLARGSPLCRASAHTETFDGFQIALKGGQLGQTDYFGRIRRGK